jgi:hypothetical protein
MPEETSKAVSDLVIAAKKIGDAVESAGNFIGKIVGPPAEQLSSLLSDQLRFWKARNLNRIANKYEELARERAWHPDAIRVLPFGVSVQAIEKAALEDDDTLQTMWARLFVNATDPNKDISITKVHTDLLSSLTSIDAHILQLKWDWLFHSRNLGEFRNSLFMATEEEQLAMKRRNDHVDQKYQLFVTALTHRELDVAMYNLLRLQIIEKIVGSFDYHMRPSFAIRSRALMSEIEGIPDTDELGRILDDLADASRVTDVSETVAQFYEARGAGFSEIGTERTRNPTNLCEIVLGRFNFTSLGSDLMRSVES